MSNEFLLDNSEITDNDYYSAVTKNNRASDLLIQERKWFQRGIGSINIVDMDDQHLCNTMSWLSNNRSSVYRWSDHMFNMQREYNKRLKAKRGQEQNSSV